MMAQTNAPKAIIQPVLRKSAAPVTVMVTISGGMGQSGNELPFIVSSARLREDSSTVIVDLHLVQEAD